MLSTLVSCSASASPTTTTLEIVEFVYGIDLPASSAYVYELVGEDVASVRFTTSECCAVLFLVFLFLVTTCLTTMTCATCRKEEGSTPPRAVFVDVEASPSTTLLASTTTVGTAVTVLQ